MDWFVNYWHAPHRATSLNLVVARVFVCSLAAWKVFAYPFSGLADYPAYLITSGAPGLWKRWPEYGQWIGWEQTLAAGCLVACAAGLAPGISAFGAAALVSHLTAVAWPMSYEKTWLPTIYFLLLYGLHRHEDPWTVPRPRRAAVMAFSSGIPGAEERAPLDTLKWFLVTIAAIYFFAGLHKLGEGGPWVEWASPVNMARMLERRAAACGVELPALAAWLIGRPWLLAVLGCGTVILELGLLVAVLTNRLLTPCLLCLAAMHLGIWATMSVNYVTDFVSMYLVFLPWDSLVTAARRRGRAP